MRRNRLATALVVTALLAAACSSDDASDDAATAAATDEVITVESTSTTAAPASTTTVASTTTAGSADDGSESVTPAREPAWIDDPIGGGVVRAALELSARDPAGYIVGEIGPEPVLLPPDQSLTTVALGTPLTFSVPDGMRLDLEIAGDVFISDAANAGVFEPAAVGFHRNRNFVDPEYVETFTGGPVPSGSVPTVEAFVAASPGIDAVTSDIEISGRATRYSVLSLDPDAGPTYDCGFPCLQLLPDWRWAPGTVLEGALLHVWEVDQAPFPDLVITARQFDDDPDGWWSRVEALIASIELGEPAADPLPVNQWELGRNGGVPAGTVELPLLGGIRFEIPRDVDLRQLGNWALMFDFSSPFFGTPPGVGVQKVATELDGTPFTSVDDAIDTILARVTGAEVTGETEVAGLPATIVDLAGVAPSVAVFAHDVVADPTARGNGFTWFTLAWVRLYLFERNGEVIAISAQAEDEAGFEFAEELLDLVASTIEFLS